MPFHSFAVFEVPLRNWRSFLPAWISFAIAPYLLLLAANTDDFILYFWLVVALLAAALWPLARLMTQRVIGSMGLFVWLLAGVFLLHAVLYVLRGALAPLGFGA